MQDSISFCFAVFSPGLECASHVSFPDEFFLMEARHHFQITLSATGKKRLVSGYIDRRYRTLVSYRPNGILIWLFFIWCVIVTFLFHRIFLWLSILTRTS